MRLYHVGSVAGVWLLMGCSSADPQSPPPGGGDNDTLLEPPAAGQGLQLKMVSTILPGQEIERCKFFQVPAEGLNVNSAVVRYVSGSHHVLLYRTSMKSIPTVMRSGKPLMVDENGVFDCAEGAAADWDVTGVVAGAQSAKAKNAATFPPGVAAKIDPGTVLIINTHYLNASGNPLIAEARLNLYTLPEKDVVQEGGFLFFYNPFIRVPARSSASSRMRCTLSDDITLISAQSHMHRRGVGYTANVVEPSDGRLTQIYESHDWEDVPISEWSPGMPLRKGQAIDYTCHYQNSEDRQVAQGGTTKDEMCMFLGNYYPRNAEVENCGISTAGGGATFIGTGTADGKATLQCLNKYGGKEDTTAEFFGCVQDSCPDIGEQVTGHLKCQITETSEKGSCGAVCSSGNQADCGACMEAACGPAMGALDTASCD
jgi:hypothetical protein